MTEAEIGEIFNKAKIPDKILLLALSGLVLGEDVFESLHDFNRDVRRWGSTEPRFSSVKKYSFNHALLKLLEAKYLQQEKEGERRRYVLSQTGLARLYGKYPQLQLQQKSFDGFFRLVVYDIDEKESRLRRQVRRGLKKLGFHYLQKSVWISPYDWQTELERLFGNLDLQDKILIFKASLSQERTNRLLKSHWPGLTIPSS